MVRVLPDAKLAAHNGEKPIVLSGEPEALTGNVSLVNPTERRVVIKTASLTGISAGKSVISRGGSVSLLAILDPGETSTVAAKARIEATTPPGTYRGSLVLGDHEYPARVHVLEHVSLDIVPERIDVVAAPGETVTTSVSISNRGNIALPVGPIASVALDDDRMNCRTIRAALAKGSSSATTVDGWLTALLTTAHEVLDDMGVLGIQIQGGAITVEPGATAVIELRIRIPEGLKPGTRYTGVAPICDADLEFRITPVGRREGSAPVPSMPRDTKKKGRT